MKNIKVIIGYTGTNFCACSEQILGCVATGSTIEEIKKEYTELLDFHIEGMEADKETLPVERGKYKLVFELDTQALLKQYQNIISFSALSKVTGINQRQLSHYANGIRTPRANQRQKIVKGLHEIGKEFISVS